MGLIRAEPAGVCGSCRQTPFPTHIVWDLPGVGRVAACADPGHCRRRATALGIWCTYEPLAAVA